MSNKVVVFLSTVFPARPKPIQTVEPYSVPTLGSQIAQNRPPRASDDYSHMFQGF